MTTTTLENKMSTAELIDSATSKKQNWTVDSCKVFLEKYQWRMGAMEYLIENELGDDWGDVVEGELTSEILHDVASDFWTNTPGIHPDATTLVLMARENNFDDDCMFYEDGRTWILGTNKRFQAKFLWTFWSWGNPCELNGMVVSLMDSEDLYIRCLASMIRANEQLDSGYLKTEGGVNVLLTAYEALTNKEFIIRLKQARMLSDKVARDMRSIESEILEWDDFTVEQKEFLSKFLREQGI